MREVCIGNKIIGDGHPILIIFEPGATHAGLESAKRLVKATSDAGADGVKFQTLNAEKLMGKRDLMISYSTKQGEKKESIYEALKRRQLKREEWLELSEYCKKLGLLLISTPSDPETVDLLVEMKVDAIKVSKSDINHFFLVDYIAKKNLPVILDGREKFENVQRCVEICEENRNFNIIIMHCPSGYPAKHAGIHLSAIPNIKSIFKCPIGYADHSVGEIMNFAAIGLGANMLEKTITLDRYIDAVEHYMSLEPEEMKEFVMHVRDVEKALGDPKIIFSSRVKEEHRRSIVAGNDIKKGKNITIDMLDFRRPGTFISGDKYLSVLGKKANQDIEEGTFLTFNMLED